MKKTTFYNIAFVCLAFAGLGVFTAFNDAQTDDQKVDAAYDLLLTTFATEKDAECKAQALAQAATEFQAMQAAAALTQPEEEANSQPKKGGTKTPPKTTPKTQTGGTETPTKEEPKTVVVDPKDSKMSGDKKATTDAKDDKMKGGAKSGETNTDAKDKKMQGK